MRKIKRDHFFCSMSPSLFKMSCIMLSLCVLFACTTAKPSAIDAQLSRQEGYEQIQNGLRIYVRPLKDIEEIERYFSTNLLEKNILPVFILAENKDTSRYFLVEPAGKDDPALKNGDNPKAEGSSHEANAPISSKDAKEMVYETDRERFFIMTGPVIWLAILPLAIQSGFQFGPTDASKSLQQAMIAQSFRRQTLTPGRSEQGFLYYQIPADNLADQTVGISIKATDVETQEPMYFRFTKDIKSGGER